MRRSDGAIPMDETVLILAERLSAQSSPDEVWNTVCDGLAEMGFAEVSWGHVDPGTDPPSGMAVRSTVPLSVWKAYYKAGLYQGDPTVAYLLEHEGPHVDHFGWYDMSRLPPGMEELGPLFTAAFLPARFAVSERALGRTKVGILALGTDHPPGTWRARVERHRAPLTLAARMCAAYLAGAEPPAMLQPLSAREAECLQLLARGLRNDRIAERLGLHRATVEMHIARARRKLGAQTREQAIAKAVAAGAIHP